MAINELISAISACSYGVSPSVSQKGWTRLLIAGMSFTLTLLNSFNQEVLRPRCAGNVLTLFAGLPLSLFLSLLILHVPKDTQTLYVPISEAHRHKLCPVWCHVPRFVRDINLGLNCLWAKHFSRITENGTRFLDHTKVAGNSFEQCSNIYITTEQY